MAEAHIDQWKSTVRSIFGCFKTNTYCVPPCIPRRLSTVRTSFAGQPVLVAQPHAQYSSQPSTSQEESSRRKRPATASFAKLPKAVFGEEDHPDAEPTRVQMSDIRDDFAQQHVLHCLKGFGEKQKQPMFIISQFDLEDYLGKIAKSQDAKLFPLPRDLPDRHDHKGDFDILIIHREYGVLIGEIKSHGLRFPDDQGTQPWPHEKSAKVRRVMNRDVDMKTARKQLEKLEKNVKNIAKEVSPDLSVKKCYIFPYIVRDQLQKILHEKDKMYRECIAGPGADAATAARLCLTSDDLSAPESFWVVDEPVINKIGSWFQCRVADNEDPHMTEDVYLDLLARFVGPASTARVHCPVKPRLCKEVRTEAEMASHMGEVLSQILLTPQQFELLQIAPDMVCVAGPPGTGKTIVLVLIGLEWLRQGRNVYILCSSKYSKAVCELIKLQLEMTLRSQYPTREDVGQVHIIDLNLFGDEDTVEEAADHLLSLEDARSEEGLHILMDEAHFNASGTRGFKCRELVKTLKEGTKVLRLWAATGHTPRVPEGMETHLLTVPLRSSSAILREVQEAMNFFRGREDIPDYTSDGIPSRFEGLAVKRLQHRGPGHKDKDVVLWCSYCGILVANALKDLGVGTGDRGQSTSLSSGSPPPLEFKDVLILNRDISKLEYGSEFVEALRDEDIPVSSDVNSGTNAVIVVSPNHVRGLEQKVVVSLPAILPTADENRTRREIEMRDRLWAASRATSHLIFMTY